MATAATIFASPRLLDARLRRFRPASDIVAVPGTGTADAWAGSGEAAGRVLPLRIGPAPQPMDAAGISTVTGVAAAIEDAGGALLCFDEPDLAAALLRRSSLIALRRRADKRGKLLVLRYTSPSTRALADAAGWRTEPLPRATRDVLQPGPVVRVPREAAQGETRQRAGRLSIPMSRFTGSSGLPAVIRGVPIGVPHRGKALPICGAAVCVALAVAFLLYPAATVTLAPVSESWTVEVPLTVDPTLKKADVAKARLPGRAISREVQETATAPATGRKNVPDSKATGEVVLLNRSAQPVQVLKGSVVTAGAVKFATLSDVTVSPSRSAATTQSFGMATVRVAAVAGGVAGNVERNQITKIEGPAASSLTVQNNAPTRGGTDRPISYVTEEDRRKLHEALSRTLSERLAQQLKSDLPATDKETLVPWAGQNPAVVDATFTKNVDDEAQTFALTLKLRYGATAFGNDAYNTFVRQVAAANAKDLKPGFAVAPESVQPEAPVMAGVENGVVRLTGRARARVTSQVDSGALRGALSGKPLTQAHSYLAQLPGAAGYELHSRGPLPGRLPFFGWQIGVQTKAA